MTWPLRSTLAAVAMSLALSGPARAGTTTLTTPPMEAGGLDSGSCEIIDASPSATILIAKIQLVAADADVVVTEVDNLSLQPGKDYAVVTPGGVAIQGRFYCRFTFTGSAKNVRAGACLVNSSGSCFAHADAR